MIRQLLIITRTEGLEEEEDGEEEEKILHLDAYKAFELCVEWLNQQSECELSQILVLRSIQVPN